MGAREFALAAAIVALSGSISESQAEVVFHISGGAVAPLVYSSSIGANNVVNAPTAPATGSHVFDNSGSTYWIGSTASINSVLSVTGLSPGQAFTIDWIYLGSEAADAARFAVNSSGAVLIGASALATGFIADNRNNSCCDSSNPASPVDLGVTTYQNGPGSTSVPGFSVTDTISGTLVSNDGKSSNPLANGRAANLIFAYANFRGGVFTLTNTPTNYVVFAFDDNGSFDGDYDDFIGAAAILAGGDCQCQLSPTPLPASLPLFAAAGLSVWAVLFWNRKRREPGGGRAQVIDEARTNMRT